MFTTEIKINGSMIIHIYGRNTGETDENGDLYTVEAYRVESGKVDQFMVRHHRDHGISRLLMKILNEMS